MALSDDDRETIKRFVDYVTADGVEPGSLVARMESLKFETIVTGKTYGDVLADAGYCNVCENFPCLGGHPPVS